MNKYFVCIQPSWKRKIKGNADVGRKSVGARCIDFDLTFVALKFTYFPCVSIWVSTLMSFSMRLRSAWNILLVKYFVCVKGSFVCSAIGYWPDMVKRIPLIRDSINLFFLSYYELRFCESVHFLTVYPLKRYSSMIRSRCRRNDVCTNIRCNLRSLAARRNQQRVLCELVTLV